MERLDPFLRQILTTTHLPNKDFVKAYDCRFFFVLSGKGELRTEEEFFSLSENTLAYYPSGLAYFLKSSTDYPLSFVTVNFDFTRSYPRHTTTLRPVRPCDFSPDLERPTQNELSEKRFYSAFTIENAFSLRDDFVKLASLFSKEAAYTEELCAALLKYIILKIANHFASARQENAVVRKVMDFIEANYGKRLDNSALAALFGYHPYYLSSLFKLHTGKTLHQYLSEARLKIGADLLLCTDMPISEIALKCGFQDANHFSASFKRLYRKSPSVWRRLNSVI